MNDDPNWNALHRAWSAVVGAAGYDKPAWRGMEARLLAARRTGATESEKDVLVAAERLRDQQLGIFEHPADPARSVCTPDVPFVETASAYDRARWIHPDAKSDGTECADSCCDYFVCPNCGLRFRVSA